MAGWHALQERGRAMRPSPHTRSSSARWRIWGEAVILPFDAAAASQFEQLRSHKLGVGTADLRIAAIALSAGHHLLSRNLRDFERVPGLRVEDWLA